MARRIDRYVDELDLQQLEASYSGRGSQALPPRILLKGMLLEIHSGEHSPARWAVDAADKQSLLWLMQGLKPARGQWYRFRDRIRPEWLQDWNTQILRIAQAEDATVGRHGSLDGTAQAACASRHQLVTDKTLHNHVAQLKQAVAEDAAPVERPTPRPKWMAETLSGRLEQLERHQTAGRILAVRQEENALRPTGKQQDPQKISISLTDPESVFGRDKLKVYRTLYTVGMLCDRNSDLILAYDTFAQATDAGTLPELLPLAEQALGQRLESVTADAAFAALSDVLFCQTWGTILYAPCGTNAFTETNRAGKPRMFTKDDFQWCPETNTYICPQGHRLKVDWNSTVKRRKGSTVNMTRHRCPPELCQACPLLAKCTKSPNGRSVNRLEGEEHLDALKARMKTEEGKAILRQRPATIERRFADARTHRRWDRFHGRGLTRARTETGLVVLAHNLITLNKLRDQRTADPKNAA